jgi:hypothetical protein
VRGLRLVGVLALAIIVSRAGRGRRGEQLVVALLVVAATAATAATWAWLTREKTVAGEVLAVTRAGGPFGNYFADGVPDQWWAGPAGPNNLGLWLAVAVPTLMMSGARVAVIVRHRILGWVIVAAGLLVLLFGLAATHSRESWIAAAVAVAVLVFVRPNGTRRRGHLLGLGTGVVLAIAVLLRFQVSPNASATPSLQGHSPTRPARRHDSTHGKTDCTGVGSAFRLDGG